MTTERETTFPPFYAINSDLLKAALNCKDNRTIKKYLINAGVEIGYFGGKEVVSHEDLMNAIEYPNKREPYHHSKYEIREDFIEFS